MIPIDVLWTIANVWRVKNEPVLNPTECTFDENYSSLIALVVCHQLEPQLMFTT